MSNDRTNTNSVVLNESEAELATMTGDLARPLRSLRASMQARAEANAALWDTLSNRLRKRIDEETFQQWFGAATATLAPSGAVSGPVLKIAFQTRLMRDWVEANYGSLVSALWRGMEPNGTLELTVITAPPAAPPLPTTRQAALAPEPPQAEQTGQLVLFPQWLDTRRATAQAVFRSALFPALKFKEGRRYLEQEHLCSVEGVTVFFTGRQFDQSDLDVYLELLQIAHETPFGVECTFSAYSLLKALGRAKGKTNHEWLHSVLIRLRSGTVDMTDHKIRYFGGLIEGGFKDEVTKHYTIRINPDFARFFKAGLWASLDIEQRCALGRNQTAKALHAYYSTHAAPGPHTYEKLAEIVGLTDKTCRNLRAALIKAHDELKRIGFLSDYEAGPKTIKVTINHTPSQTRHIVQKIMALWYLAGSCF